VSVFVIVTSAPGSAAPLVSFTVPDTWEPVTAWAAAVAAVNAHTIAATEIALIAFRTFSSGSYTSREQRTVAPGPASDKNVTVSLPLQACVIE
jgi:hypothetical protein